MKVSNDVAVVLESAEVSDTEDGTTVRLIGQLDRKLYTETNKVLEALGGKWDRKSRVHVFGKDVRAAFDEVLLTGEYTNRKTDFGQFDTPFDLATDVVKRFAKLSPGMTVYEPSAGIGNFVKAALNEGANVFANEIDHDRAAKTAAMLPSGHVTLEDFLTRPQVRAFERVIMNPPFAGQADIKHVLHALDFVIAGGRLIAIMSAGVTFRQNSLTKAFHDRLSNYTHEFIPLPEGSFSVSGTNVNTVLLVVDC